MTKPGVINKKKNVYHGNHKSVAKRALRGRAKASASTKSLDETQQRKRLTNPKATVSFSKKKQRLLNKGKKAKSSEGMDEDDIAMDDEEASANAVPFQASNSFGPGAAQSSGGTTIGAPRFINQ